MEARLDLRQIAAIRLRADHAAGNDRAARQARKTPRDLRSALVTPLLNAGLVAYTDIGWTIIAPGYHKLAAAEGTGRGAVYARGLVDQTARERSFAFSEIRDMEDRARLMSGEGAA